MNALKTPSSFDTILVPAQEWGFQYVLIDKNMWYISKMDNKNINKFKYIAFYRTSPICSITCYSKVKKIIYNWDESHYDVYLTGKPIKIQPIILDKNKKHLALQSPKYLLLRQLLKARKLSDIVGR